MASVNSIIIGTSFVDSHVTLCSAVIQVFKIRVLGAPQLDVQHFH